ncbi:MAG: M23 family metallopeptidase [Acetatifactor sp.]|nr:M23 family metallopeptidase [Acetatifactor sp.]
MKDAFDDVIYEKARNEKLTLPRSYQEKVKRTLNQLTEEAGENRVKVCFFDQKKLALGMFCVLCLLIATAGILGKLGIFERHGIDETNETEIQSAEMVKTEMEQFVAPKEETQTEEITKEFKDGERETVPLVRMAYDSWICPVKEVYYETFCESTVKEQKLYVACFAGTKGDDVFAVSDGIIEECGFEIPYGNYVVLAAENGAKVRYWHLNEYTVKQGDEVKRGDVIAALGNTGLVTGPALSISVIVDGEAIKPVITDEEYAAPRVFESEE